MTRVLVVLVVAVFLGGMFVFGLYRGAPDRNIESNLLGRPVPSFDMPIYERYQPAWGPTIGPGERMGRPMVVNFWATWCGPCYQEAPSLHAAWQAYGEEVLFLGVQTQDRNKRDEGRSFLDQFDLGFPNGWDDDSRIGIEFGLFGVPETFFVAADGTIAYRHTGPVTAAVMEEQIAGLLP